MVLRYFRGDQHTINTFSGYKLDTTQGNTEKVAWTLKSTTVSKWGIRVWKINAEGTTLEITAGNPVGLVERSVAGEGIQVGTYKNPKLTRLTETDALIVRVYMYTDVYDVWDIMANFVTPQLNKTLLKNVTWTIYYYTKFFVGFGYYYWGTPTKNSRIDNILFSPADEDVDSGRQARALLAEQFFETYGHGSRVREGYERAFGEVFEYNEDGTWVLERDFG